MHEQALCLTCGELFTPRTSGGKPQVRCSEKCRRKAAWANFSKKNAPVRSTECAECSGPIIQAENGRPRRFCSDKCKARDAARTAVRRRFPVPQPPERPCEYCGKLFQPKRRDTRYCYGGWCAQKAYEERKRTGAAPLMAEHIVRCDECGGEFTAKHPAARWCSPRCQQRNRGREASRRRGPGTGAVPYADREIFERDGWRCYLCGKLVKRTVKRTDPDGATIDHIVPLSRGGADAPDNVATAHGRCNREKRARPVDYQPRLTD